MDTHVYAVVEGTGPSLDVVTKVSIPRRTRCSGPTPHPRNRRL